MFTVCILTACILLAGSVLSVIALCRHIAKGNVRTRKHSAAWWGSFLVSFAAVSRLLRGRRKK